MSSLAGLVKRTLRGFYSRRTARITLISQESLLRAKGSRPWIRADLKAKVDALSGRNGVQMRKVGGAKCTGIL